MSSSTLDPFPRVSRPRLRSLGPPGPALFAAVLLAAGFLVTALAAAPAAATETNPSFERGIHAGSLDLGLAAHAPSSIGIDRSALESWLCGGSLPDTHRGGGSEDCRLVINEDGGTGSRLQSPAVPIQLFVSGNPLSKAWGQRVVGATVTDLWAVSSPDDPLVTPCGTWSYVLSLDPDRRQPPTELWLNGRVARPGGLGKVGGGDFTGTVSAAARLSFVRHGDGTTATMPYDLTLDLAGDWMQTPNPPPGVTNLVLFASGDRGGGLVPRVSCAPGGAAGCGFVCLVPAAVDPPGLF